MNIRRNFGLALLIVASIIGLGDRTRAQFVEWNRWHMAATGRVVNQYGEKLDQFTVSSLMNLDSGECMLVLRDKTTGQMTMAKVDGRANCSE